MVLLKVISKPPTHQSLDGPIKGDQQTTNTSKFGWNFDVLVVY
jgi:hypothetical protein